MRKLLSAAIAVMAVCILSGSAMASITGSAHDFGQSKYAGWSKNNVCLPCHTAHNATVKDNAGVELGGPLWNHTLSSQTSYTLYMEPQAILNPDGTPSGQTTTAGKVDTNSMLCLSCHDGTVALDSFGGGAGTAGPIGSATNGTDPAMNFGTDLSNDHPIGEAAQWWDTTPSYMVDPALRVGTMPLRKLDNGKLAVGCTSCHEPHNRRNTTSMLWFANDIPGTTVDGRAVNGSLLCFNCHKK